MDKISPAPVPPVDALNRRDEHFFAELTRTNNELANLEREMARKNSELEKEIAARKLAQAELEKAHLERLELSRKAGMAEIATNVLHNVGNVLNSVNVSAGLLADNVKKSKAQGLARVTALLDENAADLGTFVSTDKRGRQIPAYLSQLSEHLLGEQKANLSEIDALRKNIEHIKEVVALQQSYASFGGVKEKIDVADLVEDSLRINSAALTRHQVEVTREFEALPPLELDQHKVLKILVNLIQNAKYACHDSPRPDKTLTVRLARAEGSARISVIDNGVGIPSENLTRIFNHGFTTRAEGHGFGLHSSANAAKEMGGSLVAQSDGPGKGATFVLELPCATKESTQKSSASRT